jgi:hypothetical protein
VVQKLPTSRFGELRNPTSHVFLPDPVAAYNFNHPSQKRLENALSAYCFEQAPRTANLKAINRDLSCRSFKD